MATASIGIARFFAVCHYVFICINIGVLISRLMFARKADFAWLAACASADRFPKSFSNMKDSVTNKIKDSASVMRSHRAFPF